MKNRTKVSLMSTDILNLPNDVLENTGPLIPLFGELDSSRENIIVITQLKRELFKAYVCHLQYEYDSQPGIFITDIPNFIPTVVTDKDTIREFHGVKYTMICLADKYSHKIAKSNWLF